MNKFLVCQMVIHPEEKCQQQVVKICIGNIDESPEQNIHLSRANAPPPAKGISEIVKRQVAK